MTRRRSIRRDARWGTPACPNQLYEVRQEAQAVVAATLGVELDAEQVAAGDRGHEPQTVLGLGQDDVVGGLRGLPRIRMHEVEIGPVADPVEERVVAPPDDLVPTDVREGRGILEPPRPAGQHAERLRAVLVTRFEAVAGAQDTPRNGLSAAIQRDRVDEAGVAQAVHWWRGRTHARDHDRVGSLDGFGFTGDDHLGTGGCQALLDAHEVAGAIVDDGDPGRVLFIRACPSSRRRPRGADRGRTHPAARGRGP